MRQNTQDIKHRFIEQQNKTILKYGLTTNINLEDFSFKKIDLNDDRIDCRINTEKIMKVNNLDINFEEKENRFDEFHLINIKKGITITIPSNKKFENPIKLENTVLTNNSIQHITIILNENSEVTLIDLLQDKTNGYGYCSRFVEIIAKKNSKINFFQIQKLNNKKIHYSKKTTTTETNAEVNWNEFILGSKIALSSTSTKLEGKLSRTKIKSLFFSNKNQQFDIMAEAIHRGKQTVSELIARGVVKNDSKALFRGNIHIGENADKSEGGQSLSILLLDKNSEADTIPQLLIDNEDVKCSHAVAIGRADEEKMFYLMSRGLSEKEAQNQIINGFFETTIKDINNKQIADDLRKEIRVKMKK
ncbi:MAG: Fe-S cluster assembly protein SufD [archaeon]